MSGVWPETGREMDWHISVSFLESVVFLNEVEVIPSDDNSPLHFHFDDNPSKDSASDGNIASEGTLLVDIRALNRLIVIKQIKSKSMVNSSERAVTYVARSFKPETNIADISGSLSDLLFA